MSIDKDKCFAYLGSRSKNSMLGNALRGTAKGLGTLAAGKFGKQMKEEDAEKLVNDHGMKWSGKDELGAGPAYYEGDKHKVTAVKGLRAKPVILHEMGHGLQNKNDGSNNNLFFKEGRGMGKEADNNRLMRAEREAWIAAKKLNGGKEDRHHKFTRKMALGSYENNLEFMSQVDKFKTDKDYRKQMFQRTAKKLGGAAVGGVTGNVLATKLNKKMKDRIYYLNNKKDKSYEEKKEMYDLMSKYKMRKRLSTGAGAVAGYALTKKFLT